MNYRKRKALFFTVFTLALFSFTGYALLDTFVIPRSYTSAATLSPSDATASDATASDAVEENTGAAITSTAEDAAVEDVAADTVSVEPAAAASTITEEAAAAEDVAADTASAEPNAADSTAAEEVNAAAEETSVELTSYRVNDTTIYVADVMLSSSDSLLTAMANNTYGKNVKEKTSTIAASNNALLAINGDFYGSRNDGYVIRNGVLYRDVSGGNEDLVIYADGSFGIIHEDEITAQELLAQGAQQVFSFGPALVTDGAVAVTAEEEVGKAMASNPRTAIGILGENHYVLVVSDGRTSESEGLSLHELAEFMQSLGVTTAYNLDGGGSSTMVYQGEVVNNPTTGGKNSKERSVSDIVYIRA